MHYLRSTIFKICYDKLWSHAPRALTVTLLCFFLFLLPKEAVTDTMVRCKGLVTVNYVPKTSRSWACPLELKCSRSRFSGRALCGRFLPCRGWLLDQKPCMFISCSAECIFNVHIQVYIHSDANSDHVVKRQECVLEEFLFFASPNCYFVWGQGDGRLWNPHV